MKKKSSSPLPNTILLACAILLVPVLLGVIFVITLQKFSPAASIRDASSQKTTPPPPSTDADMRHLFTWRRDLRDEGRPTDEANLRIWAAHAKAPILLFQVPPPEPNKTWNWYLSQDGRYAIAVAVQIDPFERRVAGLYDLVARHWLWKKNLLWPDTHGAPYVFNRHTVLRYSSRGQCFALEISPEGNMINIDTLGKGSISPVPQPPPRALFPGTPVAEKNNVFFVSDQQGSLLGYAVSRLPGLRYAGSGDSNTLFSGNALLKFTIKDGCVTVSDSLTQTQLQRFKAWYPSTNTTPSGAIAPLDGSRLTVFLTTVFPSQPPLSRPWCADIDLPARTVTPNFNADARYAKPKPDGTPLTTRSPDGRWELSLTPSNQLCVVDLTQNRQLAQCDLANTLSIHQPFDRLRFLEGGRYVALYRHEDIWLLDFTIARTYADLATRVTDSMGLTPEKTPPPQQDPQPTPAYTPAEATPFALYAEWFAANQAWPYAAACLQESSRHPAWEGRTPNINDFLLTRYLILSHDAKSAQTVCRKAILKLADDTTDTNRMIRTHLEWLFDTLF